MNLNRLREDIADEADWIDKRGGMISAAWVADAMRHLARYGHRRPRAGEGTHIHNVPEELDLEPPTFIMQPVAGRPGVVRPVLDKPLIPWLMQGLGAEDDPDDLEEDPW